MKNETREERLKRLTAHYVRLTKTHGVETVIRMLREIIEEIKESHGK